MPTPRNDNLAWDAFRYIAGEMTSDELAAFEAKLAEQQEARDAVADAVELTEATSVALHPEATPIPNSIDRGLRWWHGVAVGVAACLVVMVAAHQVREASRQVSSPEVVAPDSKAKHPADGALAARWSELREQQSDFDPWEEEANFDDGAGLATWPIDGAVPAEETYSTAAPDWMISAVSESRKVQKMMNDGMDLERSVDGPVDQ